MKVLPTTHDFMTCGICKKETLKLIAVGNSPLSCRECIYGKSTRYGTGIKTVVYLDPKNGTKHFVKTTRAELNHLKEWKPREHRSQNGLGY